MATRAKTWGDFKRWCDARGLKPLPAHPWTIAAYLRWVERRKDAKTARAALDVISREHLFKSARVLGRHPTVMRTLELIERRAESQTQRSALFDEDVLAETPTPTAPPEEPDEQEDRPRRRSLAATPRLKRRRPG